MINYINAVLSLQVITVILFCDLIHLSVTNRQLDKLNNVSSDRTNVISAEFKLNSSNILIRHIHSAEYHRRCRRSFQAFFQPCSQYQQYIYNNQGAYVPQRCTSNRCNYFFSNCRNCCRNRCPFPTPVVTPATIGTTAQQTRCK